MTLLLKATDPQALAGVRHLASRTPAPEVDDRPKPTPPTAEALRIAELEQRNTALETELREAIEAPPLREKDAYERGLAEGAKRAASREDDRSAALAAGLAAAQDEFSARLARLDILALELAQTALNRMFADETLYSGMVAATLRRQFAEVEQAMAIRVCVSPVDFPDEHALAGLSGEFPGLDLVQDPALLRGGCRIDLRLGRIDAGIDRQWSCLSTLIDDLAREGVKT